MDIGKAFTFVTEDEKWLVKLGIAVVLSFFTFLILPIFLLAGYLVGVTRNVKDGLRPLPEWDDLGRLFMDGLYISIAQLVYTLPVWLLMCIAAVVTAGAGGLSDVSADAATAVVFTTWAVVGCLFLVFLVALLFISPALVIQYVRYEQFGAMFRVGEVLAIARDNIGRIVLVAAASFATTLALSAVVSVLNFIPCLGTIVSFILSAIAGPWIMVAVGHMYGQIAGDLKGKAAF